MTTEKNENALKWLNENATVNIVRGSSPVEDTTINVSHIPLEHWQAIKLALSTDTEVEAIEGLEKALDDWSDANLYGMDKIKLAARRYSELARGKGGV